MRLYKSAATLMNSATLQQYFNKTQKDINYAWRKNLFVAPDAVEQREINERATARRQEAARLMASSRRQHNILPDVAGAKLYLIAARHRYA